MTVTAGLPGSKDTRVRCVATDVAAPGMEGTGVQIYRRDQHFKGATSLPEQDKQQAGCTLGVRRRRCLLNGFLFPPNKGRQQNHQPGEQSGVKGRGKVQGAYGRHERASE